MPAAPQLMQMVMTMALLTPVKKLAEKQCKEFAKELEKKAKTMPAKKFSKAVVNTYLCGKAENLGKDATKLINGVGKGVVKQAQKDIDKEIAKQRDPSSPKALELHNLRGTADTKLKGPLTFEDKALEMPKPKGHVIHSEMTARVLSKDNVEVNVIFWLGIDAEKLLKVKDKDKPKVTPVYGIINLEVRF